MADQAQSRVAGDPLGESRVLIGLQRALDRNVAIGRGGRSIARGMSHFGEHALGWMGTAAAGYLLDPPRRRQWAVMGVSAFSAHAASVIIKRVVRRPRPHDPAIVIGVGTPSKLSFPSSHATSSTAALVALSQLTGSATPLAGIPAMGLSRLILGVHYPTDVLLGSVIGLMTTRAVTAVASK